MKKICIFAFSLTLIACSKTNEFLGTWQNISNPNDKLVFSLSQDNNDIVITHPGSKEVLNRGVFDKDDGSLKLPSLLGGFASIKIKDGEFLDVNPSDCTYKQKIDEDCIKRHTFKKI